MSTEKRSLGMKYSDLYGAQPDGQRHTGQLNIALEKMRIALIHGAVNRLTWSGASGENGFVMVSGKKLVFSVENYNGDLIKKEFVTNSLLFVSLSFLPTPSNRPF